MRMPKTSVYVYYRLVFGKYDIRFSREVLPMESVSEPVSVKEAADEDFWLCVPALYRRHIYRRHMAASLFGVRQGNVDRCVPTQNDARHDSGRRLSAISSGGTMVKMLGFWEKRCTL